MQSCQGILLYIFNNPCSFNLNFFPLFITRVPGHRQAIFPLSSSSTTTTTCSTSTAGATTTTTVRTATAPLPLGLLPARLNVTRPLVARLELIRRWVETGPTAGVAVLLESSAPTSWVLVGTAAAPGCAAAGRYRDAGPRLRELALGLLTNLSGRLLTALGGLRCRGRGLGRDLLLLLLLLGLRH